MADVHIREFMAAESYNYKSADNKTKVMIPTIIITTIIPGCGEKTIALYKKDGFA